MESRRARILRGIYVQKGHKRTCVAGVTAVSGGVDGVGKVETLLKVIETLVADKGGEGSFREPIGTRGLMKE